MVLLVGVPRYSYWPGGRTADTASRSACAGWILVPPSGERRVVERVLWRSANLGFAARTALSIGGIIVVVCVGGWVAALPWGWSCLQWVGARLAGACEGDAVGAPQRVDLLGWSWRGVWHGDNFINLHCPSQFVIHRVDESNSPMELNCYITLLHNHTFPKPQRNTPSPHTHMRRSFLPSS